MMAAVFFAYAVGHLALFLAALTRLVRFRTLATLPLVIVTLGLVYDNVMIALGSSIGAGEQLQQLSVPRYFLHAMATPLLMLAALGLVQRSGATWSRSPAAIFLLSALVLGMIATGFWSDMIMLHMEPETEDGLLTYTNVNSVPIAPIVTVAVLIAAGVVLWRRGGGPWLLAGALAQLAVTFAADLMSFAGNLGELALLAGMVWSDWRLAPSTRQRPEA